MITERILSPQHLQAFRNYLIQEEKSEATIEKYLRDTSSFLAYTAGESISKEQAIAYKQLLQQKGYAVRSINSMLASINSLLDFLGWTDCKVKNLRCQQQTYCAEEKELTKTEYIRLVKASKHRMQLNLVIQTICGTGIRVSELQYFTVESIKRGTITVCCKGKNRTIMIPGKLKKLLLGYAVSRGIGSGILFRTRSGKPLDRSNIWAQMKSLCLSAGVNPDKVFPHNLRKLFARTFYGIEKDIAKLADVLGHSSINTTRLYIITTGNEHRKKLEQLGLVMQT